MAQSVHIGQRCQRDVEGAAAYYKTHGGNAVADGFLTSVEEAFDFLAMTPLAGSLRWSYELEVPDLRSWPLDRFPHLLFYVARDDGIHAWRILHAHRDIAAELQTQD